jgi:hypothetical protein
MNVTLWTNPEMQTLSTSQLKAAALLADGMSKADVAMSLDVHVRTITRWGDSQEFQREVNDRRALREAGERISEAKQVSPSSFNLPETIADLREAKKATRLQVRAAGSTILEKCLERLQDIPAEAVPIKDLPQFFRVGRELLEWADEQESQELEISTLIERLLGPESLTAQKVKLETENSIDRSFQAIADSGDFSEREKLKIFEIIAGTHVSD